MFPSSSLVCECCYFDVVAGLSCQFIEGPCCYLCRVFLEMFPCPKYAGGVIVVQQRTHSVEFRHYYYDAWLKRAVSIDPVWSACYYCRQLMRVAFDESSQKCCCYC